MGQHAEGSFNALAAAGATATVHSTINNHFRAARIEPVAAHDIEAARQQLAEMPVDAVPDPAGLPMGSRRLFSHNRLFLGRADEFRDLARSLRNGGAAAIGQSPVLSGCGGSGKTQLASEFAWRYGQFFAGGVFWLRFETADSIPAEIAACGTSLSLHAGFTSLQLDTQVALVSSRLQDGLPRLLIFDNCEDTALYDAWGPPGGDCRVLLTSRQEAWPAHTGVAVIPLGVLPRLESIALLRQQRPDLDPGLPALDAICEELGELPLAPHLAGSYMAIYRNDAFGTPEAYLDAICQPDLLEHHSLTGGGKPPTGREAGVAATFALSLDRLEPAEPVDALARSVLTHAAWFAPGEPIPGRLLRRCLNVSDAEEEQRRFADALRRLAELGLVRMIDGAPARHRLIATIARTVGEAGDGVTVEESISGAATEQSQAGLPSLVLVWQAHLRFVAREADARGSKLTGRLFNSFGYHLHMIADLDGDRDAYQRALSIFERFLGSDHPSTVTTSNNFQSLGSSSGKQAPRNFGAIQGGMK
ncbi:hypothetical protein HH303_03860 [Rhodospirillaceae bacterium KN72]|uniref:NB-ARC domain-containing protein n=1 Tax=Pacificispira spongiicola TaxID=2729598 RepID=A0A7Y0HFS5_9PROT|nr:hypothetical protein [Pacificispira spongiicola]NMM43599.1 hypothetical protein [Pacificispira spongiicola]